MNRAVIRDPVTGRAIGRNLVGRKVGQLEVIEPTGAKCPNGYWIWRARCSCGTVIERPSYLFVRARGGQKTCGCGPKGRPRIPDNGAHVNAIFAHCRQSARVRGITFDLSRDDVKAITAGDCDYCGGKPETRTTHKNLSGTFDWNGIDRVDSRLGYTRDNCVACCPQCNWAKRDQTVEDFRAWVKRVHDHLGL